MGADNVVTIALTVDNRAFQSGLAKSKGTLGRFKGALKSEFASIGRSMRSALSFASVGGIAGIAAAGKQVLDFQRQLLNLGVRAKLTGVEMKTLETSVFKVGQRTAQQPEQLLAGAAAYQELTGDARSFIQVMEAAARVSTATGASMEDIARTQAALSKNLGVTAEEMDVAFNLMARGADAGAIEFRDFAGLTQGLTANFKLFNKTGVEGLNELQGMLQIARNGFGSAAEAATGFDGAMIALIRNQEKFEKAGVKMFENGKRRGLLAIFEDLKKKGFSDKKLIKLFRRAEGFKAFKTITDERYAGDLKNVMDLEASRGFVLKDFNRIIDSTPAKIDRAKVKMKEAFNKALADNIDGIAKAMTAVADAISWIADNPKSAAAIAVIAKLASIFLQSKFGGGSLGGSVVNSILGESFGGAAASRAAAGGGGSKAAASAGALLSVPLAIALAAPLLFDDDQGERSEKEKLQSRMFGQRRMALLLETRGRGASRDTTGRSAAGGSELQMFKQALDNEKIFKSLAPFGPEAQAKFLETFGTGTAVERENERHNLANLMLARQAEPVVATRGSQGDIHSGVISMPSEAPIEVEKGGKRAKVGGLDITVSVDDDGRMQALFSGKDSTRRRQ